MAAMNNQLVRVHRDIEAWDAEDAELDWRIKRIVDRIMALDEEIANVNENADPELLPLVPVNAQTARLRGEREALYSYWDRINRQLRELRFFKYRPLKLQDFLEACHSIDLAMPARDILPSSDEVMMHEEMERMTYPKHVVPATDFAAKQMGIWEKLAGSLELYSEAYYMNYEGLEWVLAAVDGKIVGCPHSLSVFMQTAVDEAVDEILEQIAQDGNLTNKLQIEDFVRTDEFDETIIERGRSPLDRGMSTLFSYRKLGPGIIRETLPVLVTYYRPPNRLSLNEILAGLRGSIDVADQVILSPVSGMFDDMSKVLVVAVITQLFDHMLVVGTRFGYITTGEAYIFLEISEHDAGMLSYSVCVPRHDVETDPVTGLHRTAVAQMLAFTLRALRAIQTSRMSPLWYHEARRTLWNWRMNPDDIFNKIPPVVRKAKHDIEYLPHSWGSSFQWSPIRQRVPAMLLPGFQPRFNEADFNDFGIFKSFSSHRIDPAGERIDQRPFCTPECLWGLERFTGLNKECPNFRYHGDRHLQPQDLLNGLRRQLDDDVANQNLANYQFLRRSGPYTVLLKMRLASHGYTLLLKGVIPSKVNLLHREANMYDKMLRLQGFCVPVNFGMIHTQNQVSSNYYGVFKDFMVFGGFPEGIMPLFQCVAQGVDKQMVITAVNETFRQIHRERVLHFDPEPRNMLYDARENRVIVADFERAVYDVLEGQQYLNAIMQIEGVHEGRPERTRILLESFERERQYVRQRVEEFFERGY